MTSDTAVAPGWDDGDHSSTLYGGFSGEWLQEAGDMTPQQGKLRLITLKARKLGILTRTSNELIADGMSSRRNSARQSRRRSATSWTKRS